MEHFLLACAVVVQDVSSVHVVFFFPSGEHLPFPPSSVCRIRPLLVQSPAEDHEQERIPPAGDCSLATCLAPGKTACRNWEHLRDSHILEAAPANRVAGEAQQRQRWIPLCMCVCVWVGRDL